MKVALPMGPLLGQNGQKLWLLDSDPGCHIKKQKDGWEPQNRTCFPRAQAHIQAESLSLSLAFAPGFEQ